MLLTIYPNHKAQLPQFEEFTGTVIKMVIQLFNVALCGA